MESRKRIQLKPRLSIAKIGKPRFWTGIGLGVLNAIVFFMFIFFFFEIINIMKSAMGYDIPLQSEDALFFEQTFLFSTAIALGISAMIRYWFLQPAFHFHKTRKNLSLRIANYSLFVEFVTWYMVIVFIRQVLYNQSLLGTRIYEYYEWIFYIIPVYLFLTSWTEVSRYFKVWKWKFYVFIVSIVSLFLLSFINLSSYYRSETVFQKIYEEELFYLNSQIALAENNYQIEFDATTITTLKRVRTHELRSLLIATKNAFQKDEKVSMKQILLEKILIHNFKSTNFEFNGEFLYAYPIDVYSQLKKVAPNSDEAIELLNILEEFYQLTFFMGERLDTRGKSITFRHKVSILQDTFEKYRRRFTSPYRGVSLQIKVIAYRLQKQDVYKHPFVTELKENNFPPPIPLDTKYYDLYPELKYISE
ncbi:hypothetical protein H2O64_07780 [Kordia sp. YSTF-M3]|uniref:Histidine kinase n=1 Tax=Kordia aestuariivivens TaxID=2759037 RepID=A0ABR7Q7M8_9FLAO|nr:hypothetical protein [Kordia aestuariivivens]MBC8754569.1 hypothetical protein [Kordia aestuariivivens]